jgi:ergothioneine biosynthesis protein EgtB
VSVATCPDTNLDLATRYQYVRSTTERLAEPLSAEDQVVQSMPDVSPTKWHRAHVTWFFETFLLVPHLEGYQADPLYGFLWNSYYEAVGERHPRPQRGLITRPTVAEVGEYRRRVDDGMRRLLAGDRIHDPAVRDLVVLGLHHEQQHQELLLMDIKHVLSSTVVRSPYRREAHESSGANPTWSWVDFDGGVVEIGHQGDGFAFDNEGPRHEILLQPYRLADRLVTAGDWLAFMDDDGYRRADLWLSNGWHHIAATGWDAPSYWRCDDDGQWLIYTLDGERPVDPAEPVVHVSYYEADAFARWSGARLPTEAEWEAAAADMAVEGNLLPADHLHPIAVDPTPDSAVDSAGGRLRQIYGDVWEWTASPYVGYPGFKPVEGAVGEYNGKFMIDQQVLRGGCAVTPDGHVRASYRNFFPASARWQFGGLRLADHR